MKIHQLEWRLTIILVMVLWSSISAAITNASFSGKVALVVDGKCNAASPSQFLVNYSVSGSVHDTLNDYYSMYLVDGNNTILMMSTKSAVVDEEHTHIFPPSTLADPTVGPFKFIMVDSTSLKSKDEDLGTVFNKHTIVVEKEFDAHALDADCPLTSEAKSN